MKISQGDAVQVITGKDRGKKGIVMRVLHAESRLIVSGINLVTRHVKKNAETAGKKIRFEASIHSSNVMILDPKTGKPTRIGYRIDQGKKVRFAKISKSVLARTKIPKADKEKAEAAREIKPEAKEKAKKSPFWKKGGFGAQAISEEGATKTEAGPAKPAATHTRSAGRGS
ncbi:50S ribosomal protein L24 [Candidatus Peribacteria bacterium RIFCSPLOWO2_01_FULL_51_18]|nr:MAG: 50S ribosomal protein L24 [Candidatus Peribacteria bacterium RIFCSPLOWO2_01_FULL_51_18]OGJ69259.1 MAG: 50S ribosomal protein L24 [Candidatus Peribacteria bacterium RIFCSPLOWO2_02_FULL_51_10]